MFSCRLKYSKELVNLLYFYFIVMFLNLCYTYVDTGGMVFLSDAIDLFFQVIKIVSYCLKLHFSPCKDNSLLSVKVMIFLK